MSNTRKWDKRKMKSHLPPDKWTYLNLFFPKILVDVFVNNYTFYLKGGGREIITINKK